MKAQKEFANAKINLYLDVISRREDGFHDIKTVMHSVSLADEVTVIYRPSQTTNIKMSVIGNRFLPTDGKNLAVRAAALYLDMAKKTADIEIILKKKSPVAAGLAGGSSDAAATLRAMNKLFDKMFTERALYKMAEIFPNCYVIDFCKYGPLDNGIFREKFYMIGHLTPAGYLLTAKMVMTYIDYIIRHNIKDFDMVGFIGKEHLLN